MYFVILDTTLDLKAFKDYPELLKTEVSVRSERCCILIVEKHSSPAALHMRSFNMHAQKNTPDRCRSSVMCCDETVCDLPDLWVCVYSTVPSFRKHAPNNAWEKWNVKMASLQVLVCFRTSGGNLQAPQDSVSIWSHNLIPKRFSMHLNFSSNSKGF